MLLLVKRYLRATYQLTDQRIQEYNPSVPVKTGETLRFREDVRLEADDLRLDASSDFFLARNQCDLLARLMREDANDFVEDYSTKGKRKGTAGRKVCFIYCKYLFNSKEYCFY